MTPDERIRKGVLEELRWAPGGGGSNLGVQVCDGIVTLSGFVPTHHGRLLVECAAKRVRGVLGVANEVRVAPGPGRRRSDTELVRACLEALRTQVPESAGALQVLASDAHVTLEGAVATFGERQRAENTARAVPGVASVDNLVAVKPDAVPRLDSRFGASLIAARGSGRVH